MRWSGRRASARHLKCLYLAGNSCDRQTVRRQGAAADLGRQRALVAALLYQTTDGEFADRAIAELSGVGIRAFREGRGENEVFRGRGAMINIYVEKDSDYQRASQVLLDIGAIPGRSGRIFTGSIVRLVLLVAGALLAVAFILSTR